MPELDQQLREAFDRPLPVSLEEARNRRSPRAGLAGLLTAGRPGARVALTAAAAAVLAAAGVLIAAMAGGGGGPTSVAVGPLSPVDGPPVTATVSLPHTTVVAGTSLRGVVVVDNRIARAITLCPSLPFVTAGVTATNSFFGYAPLVGGCHRVTLRPGPNRFPFQAVTTATACSQSARRRALPRPPLCHGDELPPLAPGRYQVVVHLSGLPKGSHQPAPVLVRLVARPPCGCTTVTVVQGSTPSSLPCPSQRVKVPVTGLRVPTATATATATLSRAGLAATVVDAHSARAAKDVVISSEPAAGSAVAAGGTVAVTICLGPAPSGG